MIDFHTHILPGIDDGSSSTAESINMLKSLESQGVKKVVFTPHFYAYSNDIEEFCKNRRHSFRKLKRELLKTDINIEIYLGCEVLYFDEIWCVQNLEKLCLSGTKYILVEMPFSRWTRSMVEAFMKIQEQGITPIIAHVDRYLRYNSNLDVFFDLAENGIFFQVNSDFIKHVLLRNKIIKLFKYGLIRSIGSDCHGMKRRTPDYIEAIDFLKKKLSKEEFEEFEKHQKRIMHGAKKVAME